MQKTDKEVLELCKGWFEDIMERSDRLTSGNVAHGRAAIRGVAKNYAEFVAEHLEERWKPNEIQLETLKELSHDFPTKRGTIEEILKQLKQL